MNKDQTILVTGGAGYIGSHAIIDLIECGYQHVISVDDFSNSSSKTYDRIERITGVRVKSYKLDLKDLEGVRAVFAENKIGGIIHFAAHKAVGESVLKPMMYYSNNLISLVNVLSCCAEYGVNKLIFSSSCTVYGEPDQIPVTEQSPVKPAESPYGNTKQIAEEMIQDFAQVHPSFRSTLLRYFNPVGAHPSGLIGELPLGVPNNLVPFITQTAVGKREKLTVFGNDYPTRDGSCIRDYIHVMDIVRAHVLALEKMEQGKEAISIYNLGTGNGVSVLEVVEAFEKASGQKLNVVLGERREGDIAEIYSDSAKAYRELEWSIRFNLEEMMASAWKWENELLRENE